MFRLIYLRFSVSRNLEDAFLEGKLLVHPEHGGLEPLACTVTGSDLRSLLGSLQLHLKGPKACPLSLVLGDFILSVPPLIPTHSWAPSATVYPVLSFSFKPSDPTPRPLPLDFPTTMLVVHPASTCDVCLEGYTNSENLPYSIACGHVFCLR